MVECTKIFKKGHIIQDTFKYSEKIYCNTLIISDLLENIRFSLWQKSFATNTAVQDGIVLPLMIFLFDTELKLRKNESIHTLQYLSFLLKAAS